MQLEEVVEHYGDYLYHIAYMYTKDRFVAEEMVQDVYWKFYQTRQFEGRASVKTYLTRMTINRCHDYLRKAKLRRYVMLDYFQVHDKASEQKVIEQYEHDELLAAVLGLPVKYREVIFLYYYDDLSVTDIAATLHMTASTVRTRLQRGREQLKEVLHEGDWEVLKDE